MYRGSIQTPKWLTNTIHIRISSSEFPRRSTMADSVPVSHLAVQGHADPPSSSSSVRGRGRGRGRGSAPTPAAKIPKI